MSARGQEWLGRARASGFHLRPRASQPQQAVETRVCGMAASSAGHCAIRFPTGQGWVFV